MASYPPAIRTGGGVGYSRSGTGGISTNVKVIGVPNAIRKLKLVGSVAGRDTGYIIYTTALGIQELAQDIVHSPSHPGPAGPGEGHLQKGIRAIKVGKYDWIVTASSVEGGADDEYAGYEEFGATTKGGAPYGGHPYMRPAAAAALPNARLKLAALARKLERL
jgi:hypothetical protein